MKKISMVLAAVSFLAVFTLNIAIYKSNDINSPNVSLAVLKAQAQDENEEEPNYNAIKECRSGQVYRLTKISGTVDASFKLSIGAISQTQVSAGAGATLEWESLDGYHIICPATTITQTVECIPEDWHACNSGGCPTGC